MTCAQPLLPHSSLAIPLCPITTVTTITIPSSGDSMPDELLRRLASAPDRFDKVAGDTRVTSTASFGEPRTVTASLLCSFSPTPIVRSALRGALLLDEATNLHDPTNPQTHQDGAPDVEPSDGSRDKFGNFGVRSGCKPTYWNICTALITRLSHTPLRATRHKLRHIAQKYPSVREYRRSGEQ